MNIEGSPHIGTVKEFDKWLFLSPKKACIYYVGPFLNSDGSITKLKAAVATAQKLDFVRTHIVPWGTNEDGHRNFAYVAVKLIVSAYVSEARQTATYVNPKDARASK